MFGGRFESKKHWQILWYTEYRQSLESFRMILVHVFFTFISAKLAQISKASNELQARLEYISLITRCVFEASLAGKMCWQF